MKNQALGHVLIALAAMLFDSKENHLPPTRARGGVFMNA
jgi:hypothetical protein